MRFSAEVVGPGDVASVQLRLRQTARWDWVDATVTPAADGATLTFCGPVPLTVRIEVRPTQTGARFRLIEGDLSQLEGTVDVAADGEGSRITALLDLEFPFSVPGTLLREIDQHLLPGWLGALAAAQVG